MEFKIGDKVRMRDERKARADGVWGAVGEVIDIVNDGTSLQRISVKYGEAEPIRGAVAGLFELVDN